MGRTLLTEQQLVALRARCNNEVGAKFVDPHEIASCKSVLNRRGEVWAASVLGRALHKRSLLESEYPWLVAGEPAMLIEADRLEDQVTFEGLTSDM